MLIIFCACLLSFFYAFFYLSKTRLVGLLLGFLFALIISNIYLLLLSTLSKNLLPTRIQRRAFVFSVLLRLAFVVFIALIVSKPIEVYFFSSSLERDIAEYKKARLEEYSVKTTDHFNGLIKTLEDDLAQRKRLAADDIENDIGNVQRQIANHRRESAELQSKMVIFVENSEYFIERCLKVTTNYPASSLITLLVVVVFLMPAFLKYRMELESDYYKLRKLVEMELVKSEFVAFRERYSEVLSKIAGHKIEFESKFSDPPFDTVRTKDVREIFSEQDLLVELANNAN